MPFVVGLNVNQFAGSFDAAGRSFVEEMGCHSIRVSQGHGQDAAGLTSDVNWAFARGIGVMLFLGYAHQPPNAIPNSSAITQLNATGDSVRQGYANRSANYASLYAGKVQYFEVWNEWNGGLGVGGHGSPGSPVPYADLLRRTYIAVKNANPAAIVVGCATAGIHHTWIQTVLNNGGINFMDAISVHPYVYIPTAWSVPAGSSPTVAVNKVQDGCRIVRNQCISAGRDIPILLTEDGIANHYVNNSESLRTEYFTLLHNRGIQGIIPSLQGIWWFSLEDDITGTFGLVRSNNTRKPVFFAFQDIAAIDSPPDPPPPPPDPPPGSPFELITFAGDAPLRTNYTGTIGTEFTVGGTQIIARQLGWFDDGNNGNADAHQVGIWNAAGTLLGSVTIKTGTQSPLVSGFRWENLPLDIALSAGQTYRLGGTTVTGSIDAFRDTAQPGAVNNVTYSPGVSINNGVFSNAGTGFVFPNNSFGGPGRAYIGPNFSTVDDIPGAQLPDLTILEFSYENNGIFTVVVKNNGPGATPAGVVVHVRYYVNGSNVAFSNTTVGPIASGTTINIGTSSPPFVIPEGTHDIEARVDEDDAIVETDDANNNFAFEIVIAAQDLLGWDGPFGTNTRRIWFGHPPWTIQGGA